MISPPKTRKYQPIYLPAGSPTCFVRRFVQGPGFGLPFWHLRTPHAAPTTHDTGTRQGAPGCATLAPVFFWEKQVFFFANKKKKQKVEDDEKEGGGGGGEMIIKHKSRRFPNECSWLR